MKLRSVLALLLVSLTLACAGSGARLAEAAPGGIEVSGRTVFQSLPPPDVRPAQCPLILYSRSDESRLIFISLDYPRIALIRIDGETHEFPRVSVAGGSSHRHYEEEVYASPEGAQLVLSARFAPIANDASGVTIRSASVAYTSPEGETVVAPAVGLASCPGGG